MKVFNGTRALRGDLQPKYHIWSSFGGSLEEHFESGIARHMMVGVHQISLVANMLFGPDHSLFC